jgi:hypothetical protein
VTEPKAHTCPECGTPRGADNTPSCDCTRRASDALRKARTAQAAAAEDFTPLRIRPYVGVAEETHPVPGAPAQGVPTEGAPAAAVPAVETTLPLHPTPGPNSTDLRLFDQAAGVAGAAGVTGVADAAGVAGTAVAGVAGADGEEVPLPVDGPRRRRSPRLVLLSVAGAGAVVVAAAGFASGMFSYHAPSRDRAAQEVRQSVPDVTAPDTSPTPTAPEPTDPASPSSSLSPTPSTSPSPSASSSAPTPTASPTPSRTPSPPPTASASTDSAPNAAPTAAPVLRRGDKGPEVTELQLRLKQLNLYGDDANGVFTRPVEDAVRTYQLARGIQGDTLGVYGPATRESLEAETSEP